MNKINFEIDMKNCTSQFPLPPEGGDCIDCMGQLFGLLPCIVKSGENFVKVDPLSSDKKWDNELHNTDLGLSLDLCRKNHPSACRACLIVLLHQEAPCVTVK